MSKLLLIDGHSILNRAFYGIPDLTNSEGIHTNAMYGFLNIMFRFIDEEKPDYVTVAFDLSAPTFRHKTYAEYKGTRKPMLPQLKQQVPLMKELLKGKEISITTYREGDKADTGYRKEIKGLGFAEAELLVEYGYPTQRFILQQEEREHE